MDIDHSVRIFDAGSAAVVESEDVETDGITFTQNAKRHRKSNPACRVQGQ